MDNVQFVPLLVAAVSGCFSLIAALLQPRGESSKHIRNLERIASAGEHISVDAPARPAYDKLLLEAVTRVRTVELRRFDRRLNWGGLLGAAVVAVVSGFLTYILVVWALSITDARAIFAWLFVALVSLIGFSLIAAGTSMLYESPYESQERQKKQREMREERLRKKEAARSSVSSSQAD